MRQIKFRVWDKSLKKIKLLDGNDPHDDLNFFGGSVYYYNLQDGCGSMGDDSEYVLMEWTGLTDKNGKEIYEGDILKDYYSGHCKPREERNGKITVWEGNPDIIVFKDIRYAYKFEGADMRYFEVIGNIYENPELLNN